VSGPVAVFDELRGQLLQQNAKTIQTMNNKKLINTLIQRRKELGLTQAALAAKMKVVQSTVSKMERSKDSDLRLNHVRKYAVAVGMGLQIIFEPL
jgi:DNA-binding XRE family transcriptional regulator